jgi:ABC-type multidrug transport system permease subunit
MAVPRGLRALDHPNFRRFYGGQLVSLIGTWMQQVGQSWLVLELTNDPVALGLVAAALALAIGTAMGARVVIGPSLLWLIPLQVIVVLTALSIAFAIAGFTPNPQTANLVGGSVALPLFVLTGAFLPVAAMPAPLPDIVPYAVPYAALIEAIRGIALTGSGITAYGPQVAVGIGWLVAMFLLAARAYRFTDD